MARKRAKRAPIVSVDPKPVPVYRDQRKKRRTVSWRFIFALVGAIGVVATTAGIYLDHSRIDESVIEIAQPDIVEDDSAVTTIRYLLKTHGNSTIKIKKFYIGYTYGITLDDLDDHALKSTLKSMLSHLKPQTDIIYVTKENPHTFFQRSFIPEKKAMDSLVSIRNDMYFYHYGEIYYEDYTNHIDRVYSFIVRFRKDGNYFFLLNENQRL